VRPKTGGDEPPPKPPVLVVQLVRPQPGGVERVATSTGAVEPAQQADLFPAVPGTLKRVEADLGLRVSQGQLLAEIDAPHLAIDERLAAAGVEQSKCVLLEAETRLVAARAEIGVAKAVVKQRETEVISAKAAVVARKKQVDRLAALVNQKSVEERVLDEAVGQHRAAEILASSATAGVENATADLAVKEGKLLQAEAGIRIAKAGVDVATLGLDKARLAVSQTRILAPFAGIVTRRSCSPGEFTLMRVDTVRVVVAVPERLVALTRVGVPAEIVFDSLPGKVSVGKVARVGYAVDPSNRMMRSEIDIPNETGEIRPGLLAAATLKFGKGPAESFRIPVGAVLRVTAANPGDPDSAVFVYRNGKARLTPIRVAHWTAKEAEIPSGLTAEDTVVLNPAGLVAGTSTPRAEVVVDVDRIVPPN
jgi:multidrug efflux pump subunit AcrA (membrane-fusion protein)